MRAVNLIPNEQRERRGGYANRSQGVVYVLLGMVAGVALLALLYGVARHQISSKQSEIVHYEAEAAHIQAEASTLAPYKSFSAMREGREKAVRELVDSRFDWAHVLAELGRVLPPGTSIGALEGCVSGASASGGVEVGCSASARSASSSSSSSKPGASPVASATPPGSIPHFTISGCAKDQSTVARMLTDLRLVDGATEAELQGASKSGSSSGSSSGAKGANCSGGNVSYTAKLGFQPLPTPPSGGASGGESSHGTSASAQAVSAAKQEGRPE
jgi:Tfp pilus assembly protein PilN